MSAHGSDKLKYQYTDKVTNQNAFHRRLSQNILST